MICSFDAHPHRKPNLSCDHDEQLCSWNGTPLCRPCYDEARAESDRIWNAYRAETDACPNCQAARRKHQLYTQLHETIDPSTIYGQHIPLLCYNHQDDPTMRWNTKNISAGRSIFFNSWPAAECDCSAALLFSPGRFLYNLFLILGTDNTYTGD